MNTVKATLLAMPTTAHCSLLYDAKELRRFMESFKDDIQEVRLNGKLVGTLGEVTFPGDGSALATIHVTDPELLAQLTHGQEILTVGS